jgi:hypothetical protein
MTKMIELICSECKEPFEREHKQWKYQAKISGENYKPVCSDACLRKQQTKKQECNCAQCGKPCSKLPSELKGSKSGNVFCSKSCAAKYSNAHREYVAPDEKECQCIGCGAVVLVNGHTGPQVVRCPECKAKRGKGKNGRMPAKRAKGLSPNCLDCGNPFPPEEIERSNKEYCDSCRKTRNRLAGLKSAETQATTRRSKNEIHFAELCQAAFQSVECNAAIFTSLKGNWDADVIIHDYKVAVLWNGAWHHKKITKKHSVAQVQTRDKIKQEVIVANGYIPYVINDLGISSDEKDRRELVETEFVKFMAFIETLKPMVATG